MRRGIVRAITGDLEWFANEFGFPSLWLVLGRPKEGRHCKAIH